MLKNAPLWEEVLPEVQELVPHHLLAHNSDFEKSFLSDWMTFSKQVEYEDEDEEDGQTSYEDSLFYLSLMHPEKSGLKLESFIADYGIRGHEIHRGFEDSVDLLKVLILATVRNKENPLADQTFKELSQNMVSLSGGMENFIYKQ